MRFQKAIKRIVAMGTGALMLSSAYAAADLASFPAPYVKNGQFSGVLVVGDKAAAEDVIGITDIISSLQAASVKPVSGSGGSVDLDVEGDAWLVESGNDKLELSEGTAVKEAIANITSLSFIDNEELPGLLAEQELSNSKGDANYDQRLYFNDSSTGYVVYTQNDNDDNTGDFLYFANDAPIAKYEMEFTTRLETDVETSAGVVDDDGSVLIDLEDVEFVMLGKTFQIVTATKTATAATDDVALTLMGGAVRDTLLEGNTKTYTVDGKDYEVSLNYVDSDEAQFVVNGQTTRKLNDGETDKLSDGTTMGVSEILYQDYAGGIHSATFFIGALKVEITDDEVDDSASSDELQVDDETVDGVNVVVEGSYSGTEFTLDSIRFDILADDDFYVPAGGSLKEAMDAVGAEPEALITDTWDILYKGLSQEETSEISVKASGSDDYNLRFTDGRGNPVVLPLAHTTGGSSLRMGDVDDDLILVENRSIVKDDYFVITDESDSNGERQSFALRYRGADRSNRDNPLIKFDDLGSGERIERPFNAQTVGTAVGPNGKFLTQIGEIKLGGGTFAVYNDTSTLVDDFNIFVDLNAQSGIQNTTSNLTINTRDGASIVITNGTSNNVRVELSTPNADDYDDLLPTPVVTTLSASSGEVDLAYTSGPSLESPENDDDNDYGYTSMGAYIRHFSPTGTDADELIIMYPSEQRVPMVYVTGTGVSFTETTSTPGGVGQVQKISVGAAKLASEVSNVMSQNTILVGGPCANAAAANVMGNPADCAAGFEPGVGLVQLWEHSNGNVAMLVAGYSAVDTRNAAQVVANYADYKNQLKGTKVEVRKVNNQLTVAQPAAKPAATATPAMTENETA